MPHTRLLTIAFVSLVAPVYAAGCAADPVPPPATGPGANGASTFAPPGPPPVMAMPAPMANGGGARPDLATPTSGSIHIDARILRACGDLPTAHFAFDSAAVQPEAAAALDALARCFTSGPLAGHGMMLTGHTDPRGELEYNMALGQRRAGSVAMHLEGRGVARSHVTTNSHGELDATGVDESGWARDRKVDVGLVE